MHIFPLLVTVLIAADPSHIAQKITLNEPRFDGVEEALALRGPGDVFDIGRMDGKEQRHAKSKQPAAGGLEERQVAEAGRQGMPSDILQQIAARIRTE